MQSRLHAWLNGLERVLTAATAILLFLLSVFMGYQVFSRYVLRASPFWIEELSIVSMMWIGLLGSAGCVWTDSHMSLELIRSRLPGGLGVWTRTLCDLIVALFSFFLFQQGLRLVQRTMRGTLATLSIPLGWTYLIVPASGALMTIFALVRAIDRVVRRQAGRKEGGADA